MSDKQRKSLSLDSDNAEWLSEKDNASAYVDRLLERARETGEGTNAALSLQIEQKKRELERVEERAENLRQDIDELRQLRARLDDQEDAELAEARDALKATPNDPTNPAVKNWAAKLGKEPQELLDELEQS